MGDNVRSRVSARITEYMKNYLNQVEEPVGNQLWFKQQPGEYYNHHTSMPDHIAQGFQQPTSLIIEAIESDFAMYSFINGVTVTVSPIGRYETCPNGSYKIAFVVSSNDYHFYRQDSDGLWSHKRGLCSVEREDAASHLIIDPQEAALGSYAFVTYFAITPWNNMYVSSKGDADLSESDMADSERTVVSKSIVEKLRIGMSLAMVKDIIGTAATDIGSGTVIQRIVAEDNLEYIVVYESMCDSFFIKSIVREETK